MLLVGFGIGIGALVAGIVISLLINAATKHAAAKGLGW